METKATTFTLRVADNFHYMDPDESYVHGTYDTWEAAVAKAKQIVDSCIAEYHKPGMSADEVFHMYTSFGDDPSVHPTPEGREYFSGWNYARERCRALYG